MKSHWHNPKLLSYSKWRCMKQVPETWTTEYVVQLSPFTLTTLCPRLMDESGAFHTVHAQLHSVGYRADEILLKGSAVFLSPMAPPSPQLRGQDPRFPPPTTHPQSFILDPPLNVSFPRITALLLLLIDPSLHHKAIPTLWSLPGFSPFLDNSCSIIQNTLEHALVKNVVWIDRPTPPLQQPGHPRPDRTVGESFYARPSSNRRRFDEYAS